MSATQYVNYGISRIGRSLVWGSSLAYFVGEDLDPRLPWLAAFIYVVSGVAIAFVSPYLPEYNRRGALVFHLSLIAAAAIDRPEGYLLAVLACSLSVNDIRVRAEIIGDAIATEQMPQVFDSVHRHVSILADIDAVAYAMGWIGFFFVMEVHAVGHFGIIMCTAAIGGMLNLAILVQTIRSPASPDGHDHPPLVETSTDSVHADRSVNVAPARIYTMTTKSTRSINSIYSTQLIAFHAISTANMLGWIDVDPRVAQVIIVVVNVVICVLATTYLATKITSTHGYPLFTGCIAWILLCLLTISCTDDFDTTRVYVGSVIGAVTVSMGAWTMRHIAHIDVQRTAVEKKNIAALEGARVVGSTLGVVVHLVISAYKAYVPVVYALYAVMMIGSTAAFTHAFPPPTPRFSDPSVTNQTTGRKRKSPEEREIDGDDEFSLEVSEGGSETDVI